MRLEDIVEVDPEKLGGTLVFRGTRIPVQNLFDYLKDGDSVELFLDHFPTMERERTIALLELIQERTLGAYEAAA